MRFCGDGNADDPAGFPLGGRLILRSANTAGDRRCPTVEMVCGAQNFRHPVGAIHESPARTKQKRAIRESPLQISGICVHTMARPPCFCRFYKICSAFYEKCTFVGSAGRAVQKKPRGLISDNRGMSPITFIVLLHKNKTNWLLNVSIAQHFHV